MKRKYKKIKLWIEWNNDDASDALVNMLNKNGVSGVEVDNDVDVINYHSTGIKHEHTVFRICVGDDYPVWSLLTDIATHPGVYSVGEI